MGAGVDISADGSGTGPACPKCSKREQVFPINEKGKVKSRFIPLLSKSVQVTGWLCYSCAYNFE